MLAAITPIMVTNHDAGPTDFRLWPIRKTAIGWFARKLKRELIPRDRQDDKAKLYVIPIAESNDRFTTRHPGEGRGPVPRLAERKNWIPAFAGITAQAASNGTKRLATAINNGIGQFGEEARGFLRGSENHLPPPHWRQYS